MHDLVSRYIVRPAGSFLLALFMVSPIWCGDAECMSGASDHYCSSLVCSILAQQNSTQNTDHGKDSAGCMCACHIPTVLGFGTALLHDLTSQNIVADYTPSPPSSSPRTLYHPPRS